MPNIRTLGIEGLTLIFHFAISLGIIIAYVWLTAHGLENDTLSVAVNVVIGYWFGVAGKTALNSKTKNKDDKS